VSHELVKASSSSVLKMFTYITPIGGSAAAAAGSEPTCWDLAVPSFDLSIPDWARATTPAASAATTVAGVITSLTLRRNMDIRAPSAMNRDSEVTIIIARPRVCLLDARGGNALDRRLMELVGRN
jgi:hypothetical protein